MDWNQLITLEPQLLELERELQGMNTLMGYYTLKKRVRSLVGMSRRPTGYERVPYPYPPGRKFCTAAELEKHEEKFNTDRRRRMFLVLPKEQQLLHDEDAFCLVMKHLYQYHDGA